MTLYFTSGLSHEYRSRALNGLLAGNLGAIGHAQMCHPIQDRTLELWPFELIINLATLQPIAEDRLEAEDLSLRQGPTIIAALTPPLLPHTFILIRATKPRKPYICHIREN